ncbi:acetyltransferase [Adlercreutzia sp. ZJ138]|uniref:acetyltransferase n=1 Tax=Adlercreutzia sp. ZJ138 TaxID=2709405 RepID=UPI0013ED8499|nr:acetyltransferase [Adlercreutzia sp. ZJ138]
MSKRELLIVGAGEFGQMAAEYFNMDSSWNVVGFAVEREWLGEERCVGLPVVALDDAVQRFPPEKCDVFVAVTYAHMNCERERLCDVVKGMGYRLANYVSPRAFVGAGAEIEPGSMIMEMSSIQRGARIGCGAVVWPGCTIAHGSSVGDFCWIAPGVTVAGLTVIGSHSFVGVGAAVGDCLKIATRSLIGAGAAVTHNVDESGQAWAGNPVRCLGEEVYERFAG